MRRALPAALVAALVLAAPAATTPKPTNNGLPVYASGSSIGEGLPLKAYSTVTPAVHLFGDAVTARLAIVADTKFVDPARLRVSTDFTPYTLMRLPARQQILIGRFEQITWTWTLRCLTASCVPRVPPSDKIHVFRFRKAKISYPAARGRAAYAIEATWPKVEVISQVSPGVAAFLKKTGHLNWRFQLAPVAAPTYRMSPSLLYDVALGLAAALFLGAGGLGWRWYRTIRPPPYVEIAGPTGTPLERALALLSWAHARGDETLQRKALERVAGELGLEVTAPEVDELSRTARELAWSSRTPEDEEVQTFTERARETHRQPDTEEVAE
ncbi:MAG TPA: hypothetical protein VNY33_02750 [Gaiellaceae bacterium]|nr:hypothetical protein [Gaiellaceae bacterium]